MESNLAWKPKLKNYPHFDAPISARLALKLATDPNYVKHHKFLPFLSFTSITKKFNSKKIKERVIRYGARKDAYIFSYYRKLLMDKYEPRLRELALDDCVIAYRKINYEIEGNERGKSNINFAQEVFSIIKKFGNCVAITLDISSFFNRLIII